MKPHYRIHRANPGSQDKHATLKEAETEALRLAGQHPGETFEILACLGIARTTGPAVFWNDGAEPPAPGKGQEGWDPRPAPAPDTRYPTTPLPEGFDRWECRGLGWDADDDTIWYTGRLAGSRDWFARAYNMSPGANNHYEYWEAVKDEPAYRMLEPGEVIEEGDEYRYRPFGKHDAPRETFPWRPVVPAAVGQKLFPNNAGHYRRPLNKKQAP